MTNRALVLASLASPAVSRIYGPLEADDTVAMRRALGALGVMVDDNDDPWLVLGTGGEFGSPEGIIDVGASGTTARFVTAVAALAEGPSVIDGTERMRERPIAALADALEQMGATVSTPTGALPATVRGGRLGGGTVEVDARVSSQFASAVLMVAPLADGPVELRLVGPVVSASYLTGTVELMREFGAEVTQDGDVYTVQPTGYRKAHVTIESDASAAVYPAVAAAITGGKVTISGIPSLSSQPDLAVMDVLSEMGCSVSHSGDEITVAGPSGGLSAVRVDMESAPDGAMAVAVAALFADGTSRIDGLSTLRVKETDRMAALQTELRRVGGRVEVVGDSLEVTPGELRGALVQTYDDHRMAMAMALVGLVVGGVEIENPTTVNKTWPGYFDMLSSL